MDFANFIDCFVNLAMTSVFLLQPFVMRQGMAHGTLVVISCYQRTSGIPVRMWPCLEWLEIRSAAVDSVLIWGRCHLSISPFCLFLSLCVLLSPSLSFCLPLCLSVFLSVTVSFSSLVNQAPQLSYLLSRPSQLRSCTILNLLILFDWKFIPIIKCILYVSFDFENTICNYLLFFLYLLNKC